MRNAAAESWFIFDWRRLVEQFELEFDIFFPPLLRQRVVSIALLAPRSRALHKKPIGSLNFKWINGLAGSPTPSRVGLAV